MDSRFALLFGAAVRPVCRVVFPVVLPGCSPGRGPRPPPDLLYIFDMKACDNEVSGGVIDLYLYVSSGRARRRRPGALLTVSILYL